MSKKESGKGGNLNNKWIFMEKFTYQFEGYVFSKTHGNFHY